MNNFSPHDFSRKVENGRNIELRLLKSRWRLEHRSTSTFVTYKLTGHLKTIFLHIKYRYHVNANDPADSTRGEVVRRFIVYVTSELV